MALAGFRGAPGALLPVHVALDGANLFRRLAQSLEVRVDGAGAVEGAQGVQAVADALEQVMEFRLADGLAFRLQVSGGKKDSGQ